LRGAQFREIPEARNREFGRSNWEAISRFRDYFLIHQVRRKLDYPDLKRLIISEAEKERVQTILIEDKS
jgi:hypothetical protein